MKWFKHIGKTNDGNKFLEEVNDCKITVEVIRGSTELAVYMSKNGKAVDVVNRFNLNSMDKIELDFAD